MSNESDAKGLRELAGFVQMSDAQREALERIANRLESDAKRDAQYDVLQEIGKSAYESIAEMVAALECDYDRLEELRDIVKDSTDDPATWLQTDERTELKELEDAAGDCESRDDAMERIQEDPLSVEVRTGWREMWSHGDNVSPEEFNILLGTGGPATRIIGELDEHGEPTRARLQVQDWGTQWTDYMGGDSDTLIAYCRCFYFGKG